MCYQTSQRNWVIIKMLYRYLRRCPLSWHGSRLGFVTPCFGEVSLGPLGNAHHKKLVMEICPRGNNKVVIILYFLVHDKGLLFMLELY